MIILSKLLAYSGLSTKVRAMESNLLTDKDYDTIMHLTSVSDVVAFLSKHPGYSQLFESVDITRIHRGNLEKMLTLSKYKDFSKLYNFSTIKQRKYLTLFFMKYEVSLLKGVLRQIFEDKPVTVDKAVLGPYFLKFSTIPLDKFDGTMSIGRFIDILKDTKFYAPLRRVYELNNPTLFDYELCLDILQFEIVWKNKKKYLSGIDLELITNDYGYRIDIINIQWIYRLNTYYNVTPTEVYSFLIPIKHKLSRQQLRNMVNAKDSKEFFDIYDTTFYGKKHNHMDANFSLEQLYRNMMDDFHSKSIRRNPYSHACIDTYMHKKQTEISKLITITECIRYSYPVDKILQIIN